MRFLVSLIMAVVTMTFIMPTGAESAAAPTNSDKTVEPANAQNRKSQRTLVKRNEAAKKLKKQIDKDKQSKSSLQRTPVK